MDRQTCLARLVPLLGALRTLRGDRPPANVLYPPREWSGAAVRTDLWRRACAAAEQRAAAPREVTLWGHWHGLSGGYAWPRAEIRRRLGIGRTAAASAVARVDAVVADALAADPPPSAPPAGLRAARAAEWEDAAAVALGRAVVERHPHREEMRHGLFDLCRGPQHRGLGSRRLPAGSPLRKRNLKTGRHRASARAALTRFLVEARWRAHGVPTGACWAAMPLWEDGPVHSSGLEQVLPRLRAQLASPDRDAQARLLREGHRHLLRRAHDLATVREFLVLESTILGAHANIGCVAVLDLLEHLLAPDDPRRVATAQAREYILERHHYWRAAREWSDRVSQRLGDPRIRWESAEQKRRAVARALERRTALEAKCLSVSASMDDTGLQRMARRTRRAAERLEGSEAAEEFALLARRRALQARWATKNRDRLLGLPARWDDEELAALPDIDAAAHLAAPTAVLSWYNQKLGVLLSAERPREFLHAARAALPELRTQGALWPAQVSAARGTIDLALRRRPQGWRGVRDELAALVAVLPEHTDDVLRNPYALPRELVVNGIAIR